MLIYVVYNIIYAYSAVCICIHTQYIYIYIHILPCDFVSSPNIFPHHQRPHRSQRFPRGAGGPVAPGDRALQPPTIGLRSPSHQQIFNSWSPVYIYIYIYVSIILYIYVYVYVYIYICIRTISIIVYKKKIGFIRKLYHVTK